MRSLAPLDKNRQNGGFLIELKYEQHKQGKLEIISVTNDIVEDAHFVTIGFLCNDFEGEPKVMEPNEIIEWRWFELNNLPSPIFFPSGKIIKNFLNKSNRF